MFQFWKGSFREVKWKIWAFFWQEISISDSFYCFRIQLNNWFTISKKNLFFCCCVVNHHHFGTETNDAENIFFSFNYCPQKWLSTNKANKNEKKIPIIKCRHLIVSDCCVGSRSWIKNDPFWFDYTILRKHTHTQKLN